MEYSRPDTLDVVVHYHQAPGAQPKPFVLAAGVELVELVTGGRGWVRSGADWVEVLPGSLLWHVEGDETIGRSDLNSPYSCLAVRMRSKLRNERRVPRVSFWHNLGAVAALTEESIRLFVDESFDNAVLLDHLYSKLRLEAVLHHHRRERAGVPEPLRIVRSIIETRYGEGLTVSELAREAGWSVAHLHDQFRTVYGSSPRQVLLDRRLNAAREYLVGTGDSIKQIAAATGFTHSSAFCAAFRKRFEVTPKAYRDNYYYS
ncbi:AraC family transcriptional regulator [Pelagicoccus sp. SDUM812002]|uniref:helix-turn-helix transcriptional regulator n=1 Tax=Pelagicoccus sp. SDUM812002 TaxID=3041266 RepID=UPI00281214FF|nr:AraC family transcriptional regulator [Pelagicoccus sp. SDUM812002]